jgi:hypothetical protein
MRKNGYIKLFVSVCQLLHDNNNDDDDDDFLPCLAMSFACPTIIIYIHFISYHTHHRSSSSASNNAAV